MTVDSVRHLDQSGGHDARPATTRTLGNLIGQIRNIMRADDPLIDGLSVSPATAVEGHKSVVLASVE